MGGFGGTGELTPPVTHDGCAATRILPREEIGSQLRVITADLGGFELRDERTQMHEESVERGRLNGRGKTPIDRSFLSSSLVSSLCLSDCPDRRGEATRMVRRIVHRPRIRALVECPESESPMNGPLASGWVIAQVSRTIIERQVPQLGHRARLPRKRSPQLRAKGTGRRSLLPEPIHDQPTDASVH